MKSTISRITGSSGRSMAGMPEGGLFPSARRDFSVRQQGRTVRGNLPACSMKMTVGKLPAASVKYQEGKTNA